MKSTTVLDNLQKIIETAEIISSVIPDEAMDDNWVQETIDNALGELERTTACLKDKYELDVLDIDSDMSIDDYLSNSEFDDDDESFLDDEDYDETEEYEDFDFDDDDDNN